VLDDVSGHYDPAFPEFDPFFLVWKYQRVF
jgi:hypothetical protein